MKNSLHKVIFISLKSKNIQSLAVAHLLTKCKNCLGILSLQWRFEIGVWWNKAKMRQNPVHGKRIKHRAKSSIYFGSFSNNFGISEQQKSNFFLAIRFFSQKKIISSLSGPTRPFLAKVHKSYDRFTMMNLARLNFEPVEPDSSLWTGQRICVLSEKRSCRAW